MSTREHLRPLSQVEVESRIIALCDELEDLTIEYRELCDAEAAAENAYKRTYHRAIIVHSERSTMADGRKVTVSWIEAQASLASEDSQALYRVKAASLRATKEALTTKRTQLDALRTLAANIRGQT